VHPGAVINHPVMTLFPLLDKTVEQLIKEFDSIPEERRKALRGLSHFVSESLGREGKALLNFICTHNSRRSHIAQFWAQAAAAYYNIPGVFCYSGGTEATAFNPRSVRAMTDAGFVITRTSEGINPVYSVQVEPGTIPVLAFSKKYDNEVNPKSGFAAVMTCSHADQNCPFVMGAAKRFPITYEDPKDFDDTPTEAQAYRDRVHQIGREMLYAFSLVKDTSK
jgi:arsenate reductase (thioredoxin)